MARQKVTLQEVANAAGVSKWTASRAFTEGASISESAKTRVLKAAQTLGYRPNLLARSLTTKRTNMVGLVVDELANPYIFQVLDHIISVLQKRGVLSIVLNMSDEGRYCQSLALAEQLQVDGLVFIGTGMTEDIIALARRFEGLPIVALFRELHYPDIPFFTTDDFNAAKEGVRYLFQSEGVIQSEEKLCMSPKTFLYVQGPTHRTTALKRLDGFQAGLKSYGYDVNTVLKAEHYSRAAGYQVMRDYLEMSAPDVHAVFCENDILAIGVLDALCEKGLKETTSVIGFDDIELGQSPQYSLTTYRQPIERIIDLALQRLFSADDQDDTGVFLLGEWVERTSHLKHSQPASC